MGVFQKDSFTGEFVEAWKSTMASMKMNQVSKVANKSVSPTLRNRGMQL